MGEDMTETVGPGRPAGQSRDGVAVLGTGIMGSAMARNLAAAGLPTTVWDRSPDAAAPLAQAGATHAW
jgi:3-hydroxyisobutyrate dehydrogenase